MKNTIKNLFIAKPDGKSGFAVISINIILAALLLCALFWLALGALDLTLEFNSLARFNVRIWKGMVTTIRLSLYSLGLSLAIGVIATLGRSCRLLIVRYIFSIYVQVIRGTPLIMQIYLFYYIVGTALGVSDRFIAGVVILSVFEGAYIAEILRGSLISMDKVQLEAAKAVGFTKLQTLRYVLLPQLTAHTLPALTGQFASLIKDSSLLSMIALIEITQTMREITAVNFRMFECYLLLGVLYLLLTLPITAISKLLERRFSYEHRA